MKEDDKETYIRGATYQQTSLYPIRFNHEDNLFRPYSENQ